MCFAWNVFSLYHRIWKVQYQKSISQLTFWNRKWQSCTTASGFWNHIWRRIDTLALSENKEISIYELLGTNPSILASDPAHRWARFFQGGGGDLRFQIMGVTIFKGERVGEGGERILQKWRVTINIDFQAKICANLSFGIFLFFFFFLWGGWGGGPFPGEENLPINLSNWIEMM